MNKGTNECCNKSLPVEALNLQLLLSKCACDIGRERKSGWANANKNTLLRQAELLKSRGVRVIAVGVTRLIDEMELQAISSPPHRIYR